MQKIFSRDSTANRSKKKMFEQPQKVIVAQMGSFRLDWHLSPNEARPVCLTS